MGAAPVVGQRPWFRSQLPTLWGRPVTERIGWLQGRHQVVVREWAGTLPPGRICFPSPADRTPLPPGPEAPWSQLSAFMSIRGKAWLLIGTAYVSAIGAHEPYGVCELLSWHRKWHQYGHLCTYLRIWGGVPSSLTSTCDLENGYKPQISDLQGTGMTLPPSVAGVSSLAQQSPPPTPRMRKSSPNSVGPVGSWKSLTEVPLAA